MSDFKKITKQAVDICGGPRGLSALLTDHDVHITRQAIEQWGRVPANHVLVIEELSGFSRHALRPDIFGPEPKKRNDDENELLLKTA